MVVLLLISLTCLPISTFLSQFNRILQPTRSTKNERVIWIVISFTVYSDLTKSVPVVHVCLTLPLEDISTYVYSSSSYHRDGQANLNVIAIPSTIDALNHLGYKGVATSGSTHALQLRNTCHVIISLANDNWKNLRDRRNSSSICHSTLIKVQHLDVS
jgi:hypothetical protein